MRKVNSFKVFHQITACSKSSGRRNDLGDVIVYGYLQNKAFFIDVFK